MSLSHLVNLKIKKTSSSFLFGIYLFNTTIMINLSRKQHENNSFLLMVDSYNSERCQLNDIDFV
jgi:hypothetical protein